MANNQFTKAFHPANLQHKLPTSIFKNIKLQHLVKK